MFKIEPSALPVFLVLFLALGVLACISYLYVKQLADKLYKMTVIDLNKDEKLIKDGGATHIDGRKVSGGRLILTDKRLIFKSHKNNFKIYQESYDLKLIDKVHTTKTLNILLNGIRFKYAESATVKFYVRKPESWFDEIQRQKV